MRKLNEPKTELNMTDKQELINSIVNWIDCFHYEGEDKADIEQIINSLFGKYDVTLHEDTSIVTDVPEGLEGKKITVNYAPASIVNITYKGEVVKVLYRDIAYGIPEIIKILLNPDISEENKEMLNMTAYEESLPKIYHRIVLNDENRGIIIIPLIKGVTIE